MKTLYRLLLNWLLQEKPTESLRHSDFEQLCQIVQPGDVLLIDGHRRLDMRLKMITGSRWSQAVLYLGRLHDVTDPALRASLCDYYHCEPDTQLIISTRLDQGLVLQSLNTLETEHIRLCRPAGLDDAETSEIVRYAISRLGVNSGSAWGAVLWMLFPWGWLPQHRRTRAFARMVGRRLRNYTGNTIGEACAFIQFPVLPLVKDPRQTGNRLYRHHPRTHFAADFDHSPYFEIIKYPFVDQASARYGDLVPWQGGGKHALKPPRNLKLVTEETPAHQHEGDQP